MFAHIQKAFSLPIIQGNEDASRRVKLLHIILLALIGITSFFVISSLFTHADPTPMLAMGTILISLWVSGLVLNRKGFYRPVGIVLTAVLWLLFTIISIFGGGISSPSMINYFLIILVAGLVISGRAGLIVAGINSITALVLYYTESNYILPDVQFPSTLSSTWALFVGHFLFTAILLSLASRTIKDAFTNLEREIAERRQTEKALQLSESTIRALLDALPDAIFRLDEDGTFLAFIPSTQFETIVPRTTFIGKNIREILPPALAQMTLENIKKTLKSKQMQTFEYELPSNTDESSNFESRMVLIDGHSVMAIIRDVTTRVRAQSEREILLRRMQRRNAQLHTAAEISKSCNTILNTELLLSQAVDLIREGFEFYYVGLFLVDEASQSAVLRAGTGEAGNRMLCEKHHLPLDERSMIGWCITHGKTRVAQQANHDEVRLPNPLLPDTRSEIAIPLSSRGRVIGALTIQDSNENAFSDEDITMVSNMVDQLAIAIDNANLFEATENEIRERKRVEQELQQERDFAVQVMNALGQGVTVTNQEGIFDYVNPAYATMVGLSQEEIIGKSPENFTHPDDIQILQDARQKRELGKVTSYQVRLVQPGGGFVHTLITGSPRYQSSENIGSIAVITNLTEHIRTQAEREALIKELEAKNAELERFTYTVSHDLKSPLITIRGFLGYLEGDAKTGNLERFQSDLRRIGEAALKMQQLLDELLELSRIGRLMNHPAWVPFNELASEAVDLVEGRLREAGVQVRIEKNMPEVNVDRARLLEVLQNLVDNAAKFMGDQPEPKIEIGSREIGQEMAFYVKDNGIGIEPQYHERVFGLFNKLDPQTNGTGVGLALVKRIIEVHNGRIWIESDGGGKGTTFWFTLAAPNEVK